MSDSSQTQPTDEAAGAPFPTSGLRGGLRRTLAAFSYRDFRVLWFGACTSSIGTWMQSLAENWLVLALTGSATYLGLDAFLQQLPIMLFTLIGGVLADRLDRRRTLLMSQYVQIATATTLAVLVYFGYVQIWHILALSFITGCAQAFGGPAYQSLIPSLVAQARSDERDRAQFHPVQRRARARTVVCRRRAVRLRDLGLRRVEPAGHGRVLHDQRAVVPGGDLRARVAARPSHSAGHDASRCSKSCAAV